VGACTGDRRSDPWGKPANAAPVNLQETRRQRVALLVVMVGIVAIGVATSWLERPAGPLFFLAAVGLGPAVIVAGFTFVRRQERAERALRDLAEGLADLAFQAIHDSLTGLPNRVLFMDRLRTALGPGRRHGSRVAVVFVDLDPFKLVNNSMGHAVGDRLLAIVAGRIGHAVRPTDPVARFGGDEFTLLLEDIGDEDEALAAAQRVAAVLERTSVDPARLVFEITETALMQDPEHTALALQALRDLGVRLAVDDFGTG